MFNLGIENGCLGLFNAKRYRHFLFYFYQLARFDLEKHSRCVPLQAVLIFVMATEKLSN